LFTTSRCQFSRRFPVKSSDLPSGAHEIGAFGHLDLADVFRPDESRERQCQYRNRRNVPHGASRR
jgi:hypothetical protein